MTSRLPNFHMLSTTERLCLVSEMCELSPEDLNVFDLGGIQTQLDHLIENALGVFALPFGVATNFLVNSVDYLVPMVVEEPSIVASASYAAKLVRQAGGFHAEASARRMIGQVQVVGCEDANTSRERLLARSQDLLDLANDVRPGMKIRGGGALSLEVRVINQAPNGVRSHMVIVQVRVDTQDAMGANIIDAMMEGIAPAIESIAGGTAYLRILSNYTDECLARADCTVPAAMLATRELSGEAVRDRIIAAYEFAEADVYRAVTHNKGIMNGVDAVVVATGNDWRAIEAAAHAFAARGGQYRSMTRWAINSRGDLVGSLELPMPIATVGGFTALNPMSRLALKILRVSRATDLAKVIMAVGLAQNLAALRALVTEGIQKGHMALHARARLGVAAGGPAPWIEIER